MELIIWSAFLTLFIIWSHQALSKTYIKLANKNTLSGTAMVPPEHSNNITKRLIHTSVLFLAAFVFVAIVAKIQENRAIEREAQMRAIESKYARYSNNNMNSFENSFPKSSEKKKEAFEIIPTGEIKTLFSDIAGLSEVKEEAQDIIQFLQNPAKFERLGAKAPKGMLLYGPPGTGKTLLARAIAGEANVTFIASSGSQFDEEYVGVGASRVRQMFAKARKHAPCIIFIDEIDSVATKRNSARHNWESQTLNQLLAEMDGLNDIKNEGIVVVAASNRVEALDHAILRPGRLDRQIKVDLPTLKEREAILKLHMKKIKFSDELDIFKIAKMTIGFSSADLANLINEAAIYATKAEHEDVTMEAFEVAKDRIILGSKRAALKMNPHERKLTAYHEAGHAIVGYYQEHHDSLYKVTISPRGPSLGHTSFEPSEDEYSQSKKQLDSEIATLLAGRIAEEMIFGKDSITTGAGSDLRKATSLAYDMVTKWGYSDAIGLIYNTKELELSSKETVEEEVKLIIKNCDSIARQILTDKKDKLEKLAAALLERETLDRDEVRALLN